MKLSESLLAEGYPAPVVDAVRAMERRHEGAQETIARLDEHVMRLLSEVNAFHAGERAERPRRPLDRARVNAWQLVAEETVAGPWEVVNERTEDMTGFELADVIAPGVGTIATGVLRLDAVFIVTAREAMPALLKEYDRLWGELLDFGRERMVDSVELTRARQAAERATEAAEGLARELDELRRRLRDLAGPSTKAWVLDPTSSQMAAHVTWSPCSPGLARPEQGTSVDTRPPC